MNAHRAISLRRFQPEAVFQQAVLDAAGAAGFQLAYHTHDSRGSKAGYPDLHLVRVTIAGGRVTGHRSIYTELKGPKGIVSVEQVHCLDMLALAGHEVYLWWATGDYQAIVDVLRSEEDPGRGAYGRVQPLVSDVDPVSLRRWEILGTPEGLRW